MVKKSSVEAVDQANADRKQAIKDRDKGIKEAQSKAFHETYEAHEKQHKAEKEATEAKERLKQKSFLYFGLLAFTLLCCGIMNHQFVSDFIDFFKVPFLGLSEFIGSYIEWLISLSDKMEIYWAWIIRILLSALILAGVFLCVSCIVSLYKKYKERWCTLSLKVLVISIAITTIFGEPIRSFLPVNLILLIALLQIAYLIALWYFDGYYDIRSRSDEWKRIQNG